MVYSWSNLYDIYRYIHDPDDDGGILLLITINHMFNPYKNPYENHY